MRKKREQPSEPNNPAPMMAREKETGLVEISEWMDENDLPAEIPSAEVTRVWSGQCQTDGERLDSWLSGTLPELSRSRVAQLLGQGLGTVDGKPAKPGLKLRQVQQVVLTIPGLVPLDVVPQDIPIRIVYEDDDILVVDKPKGLVVHPAPGHPDGTLVNALMFHCRDRLSNINGVIRPGIVHRIDRDTSGLLVVAKTNLAHQRLSDDLRRHDVVRTYLAVVDGRVKQDEGTISLPIGRHPVDRKRMSVHTRSGRDAVTHYRVLTPYHAHTLVECRLETGRTHQIRVHMASLGNPVTGDPVYGKACRLMNTQGQALHAFRLELTHPVTGERMSFETPYPDWLVTLLQRL